MSDSLPPSICRHPESACGAQQVLEALRQEIANLQLQVITDPLTQLHNKRHFTWALETEMERTRRSFQPTSLILADLDHFKSINDAHGHIGGDRVLVAAASIIKNELRMIDIPCRYGGEEFAIILPATPILTAIQVAERLRLALAQAEIDTGKGRLSVTASLGVSCYVAHQKTSAINLVERADQKLYEAKSSGRNRTCAETLSAPSAVTADERAVLFYRNDSNSG